MDRMEVAKLVSHLVITIIVIVGYICLRAFTGVSDPTLQTAVGAAIGFWFASYPAIKNSKKPPTNGGQS